MVNAVLVQGSQSEYDDQPGVSYHFPKRYLRRMEECVGDWVTFFSPVKDTGVSKEARGAFFAVAQIERIIADAKLADHFYAVYVPNTYAGFANPVPRQMLGRFLEPAMSGKDGKANVGVALQAVRHIPFSAFQEIAELGWKEIEIELPRYDEIDSKRKGVAEDQTPFEYDVERKIVAELVNRKVRDVRFRGSVLMAYNKTCAVTGWSFVNGGGRAEVEGAHIKPVAEKGPDTIDNGLALSGTVHWMFDRGLISISANDEILISRKVNDLDGVKRIINPTGKLIRPKRPEHQPHPAFIEWHRTRFGFAA
ncbi:HNH endonuclease [Ponticaulis sp.]|uniref:HNH endonuclease n=1 Tax=Ponticaulis sp. TaxID=2020902 RepID=UPI000B6A6BD1|nr:HNH endonuclease [Ponticaulis sp.]MAI90666.1 restriction endonuclease [Ponticaulis sp.]OUX99175.1 MAG: hypothetical protein CBB65_09520 [Hyphomonadaceae bacterium TMED5]|tara:strand:+ start:39862 stop:40785 length:924 start_codon:yes stop_codon:yes gene_type:complete